MNPSLFRITLTPIGYHQIGRIPAGTLIRVFPNQEKDDELMVELIFDGKRYNRRVHNNRIRALTPEEYELGRILFQGEAS